MTDTKFLAQNIINQIGDLYSEAIPSDEWVPVRQASNDVLDAWVTELLEKRALTIAAQVIRQKAKGAEAQYRSRGWVDFMEELAYTVELAEKDFEKNQDDWRYINASN